MKVYAPMWFHIKRRWACIHGPLHIADTLSRVSELDQTTQDVVIPVIQRNAYFAHPENVLLAMVQDSNADTRGEGWTMIQTARKAKTGSEKKSTYVISLQVESPRTGFGDSIANI